MNESRDANMFARDSVRRLPQYRPGAEACTIDLSDNTNLWGSPPAVLRALHDPSASASRYPAFYSEPLRASLLAYSVPGGVPPVGVVTGCGSDDILDSTLRTFGEPGDRIAYSAPTFVMIPYSARLNGLSPVEIPFALNGDIDAERLVDADAKITYLCSPNNPTGTAMSRAAAEYVVANARGIVLLDEAYAEFAPEVFVDLLARSERLIVARTFSKAFGMAGLRVGYGLGAPALVSLVERARGPYKVSSVAERCVLAALEAESVAWMREQACRAVGNRMRFAESLAALGLGALPSAANFVCVPTVRGDALCSALQVRGILVRLFKGLPQDLPDLAKSGGTALRIGIGPWEQMQTTLDALTEALA